MAFRLQAVSYSPSLCIRVDNSSWYGRRAGRRSRLGAPLAAYSVLEKINLHLPGLPVRRERAGRSNINAGTAQGYP